MALVKELIKVLDNEDEPLQKRLKIANNAFNSDLYLQSKEYHLINWIINVTSKDADAWRLFKQWLNSEHFKNLNKIDLSQDCIKKIYQNVWEKLNHDDANNDDNMGTIVIDASLALINNVIFHEYFKSNLKSYFKFISRLVGIVKTKNTFLELLRNEHVFNKIYFVSEKVYKYFFEFLLPALSLANSKFDDNEIFSETCLFLQKHALRKNFKQSDNYLQHYFEADINSNGSMFKYLLKCLLNNYDNTEIGVNVFRIIFTSICNEYSNNFSFIYKFSIILFQILGFELSDKFKLFNIEIFKFNRHFSKSLMLCVPIFEAFSVTQVQLDLEINEVKFSEFIKILVLTIMELDAVPNEKTLNIICYCSEINPLIIDTIISQILNYFLLKENNCHKEYVDLLNTILKVFIKLHRIQNFISKMFPVLRQSANKDEKQIEKTIAFDGFIEQGVVTYENNIEKIFPKEILTTFSKCVTSLASWQVMNLFKTFLFHMSSLINENLQNVIEDERKLIYIETIGIFLCQFLVSARVAEHTVPDLDLNKFVKAMEELKVILGTFGNMLVIMEHNHILMRTFLSVCYTWGELYMVLSYYSTTIDISVAQIQDKDYSLSNISYIHPYLTAAQWSLIAERVNNFGKITCKRMMQNLFIQHIKARYLFEKTINHEMIVTLINNFMLSLEHLWNSIMEDPFILNTVVSKMQSSQIQVLSDVIINNMLVSKDIEKLLREILNCEILLKHLAYNILVRISKTIKPKKTSETGPLSAKVFDEFYENVLTENEEDNRELLQRLLVEFEDKRSTSLQAKINQEKLSQYIKLLTVIPVIYLPDDFRICVTLYLIAVLDDLKHNNKGDSANVDDLEVFLTGMLRTIPKHFATYVKSHVVVNYIVKNTKDFKTIFTYFMENMFLGENFMDQIDNISSYLMENIKEHEKYVNCIGIVLSAMLKHKKTKIPSELKIRLTQSIENISKELMELIASKQIESLSIYALTLKIALSSNNDEYITKLKRHLEYYTTLCFSKLIDESDQEDAIILLSIILQHKSKFDIVKDDFILNIWNVYKNVQVSKSLVENKGKLIVLIFGHVDNENFTKITEDLSQYTKEARQSKEYDKLLNYIDVWSSILPCDFNPVKSNIWLRTLQNLVQYLFLAAKESDDLNLRKRVLEFDINLVQTVHIQLTPATLDIVLLTVSACTPSGSFDIYNSCTKLLDVLLRYRKPLISDRLPSFLQQYRALLQDLCTRSNSNSPGEDAQVLANSAHRLEMLTKSLVTYGKHMARLSSYLIADVLQQYETISLVPEVKMHINNCVYSLLELCDQHAIAYLMRVLSVASTEIFKFLYENYNKYYRYKGKV